MFFSLISRLGNYWSIANYDWNVWAKSHCLWCETSTNFSMSFIEIKKWTFEFCRIITKDEKRCSMWKYDSRYFYFSNILRTRIYSSYINDNAALSLWRKQLKYSADHYVLKYVIILKQPQKIKLFAISKSNLCTRICHGLYILYIIACQ